MIVGIKQIVIMTFICLNLKTCTSKRLKDQMEQMLKNMTYMKFHRLIFCHYLIFFSSLLFLLGARVPTTQSFSSIDTISARWAKKLMH